MLAPRTWPMRKIRSGTSGERTSPSTQANAASRIDAEAEKTDGLARAPSDALPALTSA